MADCHTPQSGPIEFDIDARHAQTIGEGPRYVPLGEDELSDEANQALADIRKAFSIPDDAPIPLVSLITLRHPGMFKQQMAMGIELAARGTIPGRDRELAVLRLAWVSRSPFEWAEHCKIGRRFDISDEEIERVTQGSSAAGWSRHEAALLRAVEELLADQCIADDTWNTLAQTYGEMQLIELPMLVGSYLMTAFQQNSLRIPMEKGKNGLHDR
jgi:alkylhydroperoxidase family enzyme